MDGALAVAADHQAQEEWEWDEEEVCSRWLFPQQTVKQNYTGHFIWTTTQEMLSTVNIIKYKKV